MPDANASAAASDAHTAALAALREGRADAVDPVRFRYLEALARRTARKDGAARRRLETRLGAALAEYQARVDTASADEDAPPAPPAAPTRRSPLAELVAALAPAPVPAAAAHAPAETTACGLAAVPAAGAGGDEIPFDDPAAARRELKSLACFRDTWARLSADRQLAAALADPPQNAGPLNSHRLVLQAVERMRELSPAYLDRFMAYADALLWLDAATGAPRHNGGGRAEPEKRRRSGRAKSA